MKLHAPLKTKSTQDASFKYIILTKKVLEFSDHGVKRREELVTQPQFFHDLCHLQRPKLLLNL